MANSINRTMQLDWLHSALHMISKSFIGGLDGNYRYIGKSSERK